MCCVRFEAVELLEIPQVFSCMSAKVVIKQGNRVLTFGRINYLKRLAAACKIENGENAAVASQEGVEMNGESQK